MPAYIILNGRYFNPDRTAMRYYSAHVQPTAAAYGGGYRRMLQQRLEVLEGAWHPRMFGIVEFPTFEQARAWYDSPEYAPLKAIRLANVRNDTILVDALADDQTPASIPPFADEERARVLAFLAEAERRGVPPDRFHPGETVESVLAGLDAAAPAAEPSTGAEGPAAALERVRALLPALDREGRQRVLARCQQLAAQAEADAPPAARPPAGSQISAGIARRRERSPRNARAARGLAGASAQVSSAPRTTGAGHPACPYVDVAAP